MINTKRVFQNAAIIMIAFLFSCQTPKDDGPYFATGIKIGEVTQSEAIVWVRLTERPQRVPNGAPMPDVKYKDPETGQLIERTGRPNKTPVVTYPEGYDNGSIEGAVPGRAGRVRLKYKATDDWIQMDWQDVDPNRDFTYQFQLENLSPATTYKLVVESALLQNDRVAAQIEGEFTTAPQEDDPAEVNFIVTTGTSYPDVDSEAGYKLYPSSLKLNPDFFVHTGDIVYYDGLGKTEALARWHWCG